MDEVASWTTSACDADTIQMLGDVWPVFWSFTTLPFPMPPTLARCVTSRYGIGFQEVLYSIYVEYQENITWLFKLHGGQSHILSTQSWSFPFVGQGINRSMTDPSMLRLLSWSYADLKFPPAELCRFKLDFEHCNPMIHYVSCIHFRYTNTDVFLHQLLICVRLVVCHGLSLCEGFACPLRGVVNPALSRPTPSSTVPCSRLSAAFFPSSWVDRSTGLHLYPNFLTS